MTNPDPVSAFLTAIESATLPACDQLAPEMTLDATVRLALRRPGR